MKLPNRDHANLELVHIRDDIYRLSVDKDHDYVLSYMRGILTEDNSFLYAIDPVGGPYITVGYKVDDNHEVSEILSFYTLRLRETSNNS